MKILGLIVLILVWLEYSLGLVKRISSVLFAGVLILVWLEYSLGRPEKNVYLNGEDES